MANPNLKKGDIIGVLDGQQILSTGDFNHDKEVLAKIKPGINLQALEDDIIKKYGVTDDALPQPSGQINPSEGIKSQIDSIVSKSVLNPSENLNIDPSAIESFKQNPYAGVNLKEKDQNITTLEDGTKIKSPLNQTRMQNFGDTYTAGLGIKGGALIDALVNKLQGQNSMGLEPSVVDEVDNRDEFGQVYDDSLKDFRAKKEEMNKQNPIDALVGQVGGLVAPMGAFSNATKAASAIPFISKLLKSTKNVVQGGKTIAKPAFLKVLLGTALRGGTANALFGQVNQDFDASAEDRLKKGATDFGLGASLDGGIYGGLKGIRFLGGLPLKSAKWIKEGTKKAAQKIPFGIGDWIKEGQLSKFGNKIDEVAAKSNAGDIQVAGSLSQSKFKDINSKVLKEEGKLVQDVLREHGNSGSKKDALITGLKRELESLGALDESGNVLDDAIVTKLDPELKNIVGQIKNFSDSLGGDLKLSDLNRIRQALGKLSKFDSANRGIKEGIFENLYKDARQAFMDSVDNLPQSQGSDVVKSAFKNISENLRVSEGPIGDLTKKFPEEVVSKASGTGKLNLASVVDHAINTNPAYKDPIKQAVVADIIDRSKDPKALKKVMDIYENVLPKLLDEKELAELSKLAGTYVKEPGAIKKSTSYILNMLQGGSPKPNMLEMLPRTLAPLINNQQNR